MIRRSLVALAALALMAPVAAHAAWTDTLSTSGSTVTTLSLTPSLSCHEVGTSAVISWTPPPGHPATYQATIVAPPTPLTVTSNSVTVTPTLVGGLLGVLLGATLTVRVTATLPAVSGGTAWTATSDWLVRYRLVSLVPSVTCT